MKCPTKALQCSGYDIDDVSLLEIVLKDKVFYNENGGVTFSGGECLTQSDFVSHMLFICKKEGLNTAVDTSGFVPFKNIHKTIDNCDLFLYDIKSMDNAKHKKYTGVSNELILENLQKLAQLTDKIMVRVPLIPDFNDTKEDMCKIAEFIKSLNEILIITLIPYHSLAVNKYEQLGYEYKFKSDKK